MAHDSTGSINLNLVQHRVHTPVGMTETSAVMEKAVQGPVPLREWQVDSGNFE